MSFIRSHPKNPEGTSPGMIQSIGSLSVNWRSAAVGDTLLPKKGNNIYTGPRTLPFYVLDFDGLGRVTKFFPAVCHSAQVEAHR
jgi:hypothetical protein